jgi:SP family general alpha glucoside:H+ symporter-like MFS transporter
MADKNEVEVGATAEHVDEKIDNNLTADTKHMIADAAAGFANEKELGALAAVKAYPYAILWSLVMGFCVVMEGYDCALIGSFFAFRT